MQPDPAKMIASLFRSLRQVEDERTVAMAEFKQRLATLKGEIQRICREIEGQEQMRFEDPPHEANGKIDEVTVQMAGGEEYSLSKEVLDKLRTVGQKLNEAAPGAKPGAQEGI